jgi:phytoene synthase
VSTDPVVTASYAYCESLTRSAARNFSWGIRLLPAPKRAALSAVYAFSRRLDDIGDGDTPGGDKLARLAGARKDLHAVMDGRLDDTPDPVLVALADAAVRFPIPLDAFDEMIDGVVMDVRGATYDTFDELVGYCRCVAGTVGRLSLGIFGTAETGSAAGVGAGDRGARLADTLGIALQQTNILRDVREDLLTGRTYLPKEDLDRHGVTLKVDGTGRLGGPDDRLASLLRTCADRADGWYREGLGLLDLLDRRSAACAGAMAGIYQRLNERIRNDPAQVFEQRVSLPAWEKAAVAGRAIAGRPPAPAHADPAELVAAGGSA